MSQDRDALALANRRRLAAAALLREVRALPAPLARARVALILEDPGEAAGSILVERLLMSIHRVGAFRCDKLLAAAETRGGRRIREIPPLRRRRLAAVVVRLGERAAAASRGDMTA